MGAGRAGLLLVVLAAILSAAALPAAVPAELQPFSDPQGWYTIDFPRTWALKSGELNSNAVRNGVLEKGRVSIVHARAEDERTYVVVIAGLLREPMSAREFAVVSPVEPDEGETLTEVQSGATRIDGRDAYYRYINVDRTNGEDSFVMLVYVVAGRGGFQLWGETARDPAHQQRSLLLIQEILQSFHVVKIPLPPSH